MKWKDHQRLIIAATQQHHVPPHTYRGLLDGVVYPDKINTWLKKQGKTPEKHHNPDTDKIIKLIWQARRHWLNQEENDAGFQLGRALHYIHDGTVGKGFLGLFHGLNENKLNTIKINRDILYSGVNESKCDPIYIEKLIQSITPESPKKAIDRASYITASLIKAVFNRQKVPPEVEEGYEQAITKSRNIIGFIINKMDRNYQRIEKRWKWFNIED